MTYKVSGSDREVIEDFATGWWLGRWAPEPSEEFAVIETIVNREVEKERARLTELVCEECGLTVDQIEEFEDTDQPVICNKSRGFVTRAEYERRNPEAA